MNSLRCNNCSFLNFATASACKRCGLPLDAPAETQWDSPPAYASSEAYPQPTEGGSYFWDQPTYQPSFRPSYIPPPVAKKSGFSVIRIFVLLAILGLLGSAAIPLLLKKKGADFTNITWSEYRAPDGSFSVSLPAAPKISERVVPSPFGNAQGHMLEAEVNKDGGCLMMYAEYPIQHTGLSEEALYEMAIRGATSKKRMMTIGAQKYVTMDGYRGMEVELKPSDPTLKVTGGMRLFWVTPRLYVVAAGGPDTAEFKAVQTKCLESLRLYRNR